MRRYDGETGLPIEISEKIKAKIKALEDENARLREENMKLRMMIQEMREFYEVRLNEIKNQLDDISLDLQIIKNKAAQA